MPQLTAAVPSGGADRFSDRRSQLRGHGCDCPVRRDNILKHLDQSDWTERVYQHHLEDILDRSRARSFFNRLGDTGVNKQHVERAMVGLFVIVALRS